MADQPGRGRGRGLLMARLAAKKSEESSSSRAGDTSSDADTTVSEPGAGRARGRGSLLRQLQSQSAQSTVATPQPSVLSGTATPVASIASPSGISIGRGRSSGTSTPVVSTAAPSAISIGRGRGIRPKQEPKAVPSTATKLGKIYVDDAESFRSEEFVTSSRVEHAAPVSQRSLDHEELTAKLQTLAVTKDLNKPSPSPPSAPGSSGGSHPTPKGILKKSPDDPNSPGFPLRPVTYRGTGGKSITVTANYLVLKVDDGYGIFEYEVLYKPPVDDRNARYSIVNQHKERFGNVKCFDGHKLFLPTKLSTPTLVLKSVHPSSGEDVNVTFRFKREIAPGERESIYLYNLCFNKIMKTLNFAQSARKGNFFDAKAAKDIKEFRLSVWPGYITTVDVFEGGLYLQLDVAHRVLRTDTAYDLMTSLRKKSGPNFKSEVEKTLLGASVITKYNNKTYKIDDIDFNDSPKSEFTLASGKKTSFVDYYQNQYGLKIKDPNQPLLINRPKVRGVSEAGTERIIKLIPETCIMTGLTDAMRADFKVMKEVGAFTRLNPAQRQDALNNFTKRVLGDANAHAHLRDWGLTLEPNTLNVNGRVLDPETLMFGNNYREVVRPNADWGRTATTKMVLTPVPLNKWAIVFIEKNENIVKNFCKIMQQQGPKMGIPVSNPRVVKLKDDRTESYLKELRQLIDPSVQLVVTIFPQMKSDRYAAVKKLCCVEMPVASQVINLKTISNEKRLVSVVQKVALQINCKLGGELWACVTPFKGLMVVGIDIYHDATRKGGSIAGVVCSMNDACTKYFSLSVEQKQGQEIMDALRIAFIEGLIKYWEANQRWPNQIVVFRDGVGDGQLEATEKHEAEQFQRVFTNGNGHNGASEVSKMQSKLSEMIPDNYKPGFAFVVVQKRINTRIVSIVRKGNRNDYANPPPGTVVDHTVTRYRYKDFFLVPQAVNQGTVSPTHFIVLKESLNADAPGAALDATGIQKLAYKLTHMYYNWPGTVRVPAPVQYAHKLVDLVGQHVHRPPSNNLANRLYYL